MKIFIGTMVDIDYAGNEGDHGEGSEYSHYTEDDDGEHYSNHYTVKEPESSYSRGENYSSGSGDEGSYETHSSYSSDGDGEEEGDHY